MSMKQIYKNLLLYRNKAVMENIVLDYTEIITYHVS